MLGKCFTPSSACCRHRSAPTSSLLRWDLKLEGSTVQLSVPSGEEDSVRGRGSFWRCEDKHRVTAPRLPQFSPFSGDKSLFRSKCTLQHCFTRGFLFPLILFFRICERALWQFSPHPGHNALTPLLSKTGGVVDKPCYFSHLTTHFYSVHWRLGPRGDVQPRSPAEWPGEAATNRY